MEIKALIIAVIQKGNTILLRKKPDGSPPYNETWYLFGGELTSEKSPEEIIMASVKEQTGITIRMNKQLSWDTEVKKDTDGVEKYFVYLDMLCDFVEGELQPGPGIEKLEWVEIDRLADYDHVPPSRILLKKLGYL